MTTTTQTLVPSHQTHHTKQGSLKTRNSVFLRPSHYYGSMGRPSHGKRKSAVELLQESKAFYVKSESVLDNKQELKNAEHLHVRSPTVDVAQFRGSPCPFGVCPSCSPYLVTEEQFEQFQLQTLHQHYVAQYSRVRNNSDRDRDRNHHNSKHSLASRRSSVPSPGTLLQFHARDALNSFLFPSSSVGEQKGKTASKSSFASNLAAAALPVIPSGVSVSPSSLNTSPNHGFSSSRTKSANESPPPLPPKSPRTSGKPTRPHDFPQRLPMAGGGACPSDLQQQQLPLPPPPPRRHSAVPSVPSEYQQLRRLLPPQEAVPQAPPSAPITLPSPILPLTPPLDIVMESPMSDSGPIISPPPAFSTPVTPMLDRQNSSASEKSSQSQSQRISNSKLPLSAAMSVSSANGSQGSGTGRGDRGQGQGSVTTGGDVSMRYSPLSRSHSHTCSTSPMSADDAPADSVSMSPNVGDVDVDADDDSSSRSPPPPPRNTILKKSTIPKSVTENALSSKGGEGAHAQNSHSIIHPKPQPHPRSTEISPLRRPILRSKSDLSHRYTKARANYNLSGFTLVHVDLGAPAPPPHNPSPPTVVNYYPNSSLKSNKRNSKPSSELERFFDMMGLDNELENFSMPLSNGRKSGGSSPVFFSSVSSVDSVTQQRGGSIDSGDSPLGLNKTLPFGSRTVGGGPVVASAQAQVPGGMPNNLVVQHGEPSIVERNARVIKWLFNCRKAVEKSKR